MSVTFPCVVCGADMGWNAPSGVCSQRCLERGQQIGGEHESTVTGDAPERIRAWVKREFAEHYVEPVVADLVDVATGNREGNHFEREALARIFPEWEGE